MKIYDCTIFFDEKMMFDLRLNILNEFVDKFVVVESLYTHSGAKKKQNFDIDNYKNFKDKIIYILIDKEPDSLFAISKKNSDEKNSGYKRMNSLKRIEQQYNAISRGINEVGPDDLLILSDCDEIPNLSNFSKTKINNNILLFKQKIFYYKFNLLHDGMDWFGSKACKKKNLISFTWLRNVKNKKYPFWRFDTFFSKNRYTNLSIIDNGGWHFTNIKTSKDIIYKLSNFGEHNEFEESDLTEEKLSKLIENGELYYNHEIDTKDTSKYSAKIKLRKIENLILPEYLNRNTSLYKDWFA